MIRGLDPKGVRAGLGVTLLLALGIVLGSGNLRHYDPVLLIYTFGVLFSAFGVAYRYVVWLQRPATRMYWSRARRLARRPGGWRLLAARGSRDLLAQRFIRGRGRRRWVTHFLIAWGCVIAGAVTFPLVFGWLRFATPPDDPESYQVILLELTVARFPLESAARWVTMNLLNLSAVMVIAGAGMALHRRLRDAGALARQQFGNDIVPLILLLAIAVTGLMLTFSIHALGGAGHTTVNVIHALTVTAAMMYVPYGKFFHLFQRPLHLGVALYKKESAAGEQARCRICAEPFAGAEHLRDLGGVLVEGGLGADHLATCPRCKRRALGAAQGRLMEEARRG
jgi:hypothetical protein